MSKNVSLILCVIFFTACSTSNLEIKKEKNVEKEKKEFSLNKEEKKEDNFKEVNKKNEVYAKKDSLSGKWVAASSRKFLQRIIYLKQINESYAKGYLEMDYENSNKEIKMIDKFNFEVYFHMDNIEGHVTDKKTNKEEIVKIYRDSENEFRVIASSSTVFFDDKPMVFKKPSSNKKSAENKVIQGVEYFRKEKNVVYDSKNSLIWNDIAANTIIKANFNKAVLYCKSRGENYRLPTRKELKGTYDKKTSSIDNVFEYKKNTCYWSKEYSIGDVTKAWCFDYSLGHERLINKDEKVNIRCVKDRK